MMAADQSNTGTIEIDDVLLGVRLAPDYVGQHSIGVSRLLRAIGSSTDDPHGIRTFDEHVATRAPRWERRETEQDEKLYLDTGGRPRKIRSTSAVLSVEAPVEHAIEQTVRHSPNSILTGAWDETAFAIRSYDDVGRRAVDLVQAGIESCDVAIWVSSSAPFRPGSLCIARRSLVPEPVVRHFDEEVLDLRRLYRAADDTGIAERIRASAPATPFGLGCRYYALSPSWISEERRARSAHPVQFFLNPTDQDRNSSGWFTVEELDQWLDGEGPVPIQHQKGKR